MFGITRGLFRRGPRPQRLANRHHVVVDGLRQPHHGQVVVVLFEVRGEVRGSGIRIVATDGVQHIHPILHQLVRGYLQGVLSLLDQSALDQVLGIGQLDPRVTDRRTSIVRQSRRPGAGLGVNRKVLTGQQSVIAVLVGDDLYFGIGFVVTFDQHPHCGVQAGGETAGGQQSDSLQCHGSLSFSCVLWVKSVGFFIGGSRTAPRFSSRFQGFPGAASFGPRAVS